MDKIKKIFVPTDFSSCSQEAIVYAVFLAERLNATLLLAHVLAPVGCPVDMAVMNAPEIERMNAKRALGRMARLWREKGIQIETALLTGDPAALIVEKAKRCDADLIVMGTHGRRGLAHMLMGSVAEKVVRHSPLPVLTVRHRKGKEVKMPPGPVSKEASGEP
jgi:nucleotide-binding universal stress UspA family protein